MSLLMQAEQVRFDILIPSYFLAIFYSPLILLCFHIVLVQQSNAIGDGRHLVYGTCA